MSNKLKKSFETTQANKCKRFYKQNQTTVIQKILQTKPNYSYGQGQGA